MKNISDQPPVLTCACGASAANTSREKARFLRRHPAICGAAAPKAPKMRKTAAQLADLDRLALEGAIGKPVIKDQVQQLFIAQL